jgi:hypothetical protein
MPRQTNGSYQAPGSTSAVSGQPISSAAFNNLETDIGAEITNSVDRLGRGAMQAALNLGSHQINALAPGVLATDAVNLSQLNAVDSFASLTAASLTAEIVYISDPTLTQCSLVYQNAGANRWQLYKDSTAESGGNAGSNFVLTSYADDGATEATVFSVSRVTAAVAFTYSPTVPTPAETDNSSKVVNSAFVNNVLAAGPVLGNGATATTQLGTDSSTKVATTAQVQLALAAGPVLGNGATATTQLGTDNSTKVATTAQVQASVLANAPGAMINCLAVAVGSYCSAATSSVVSPNGTLAGSSLTCWSSNSPTNGTLTGTWRFMGSGTASSTNGQLWLRIA